MYKEFSSPTSIRKYEILSFITKRTIKYIIYLEISPKFRSDDKIISFIDIKNTKLFSQGEEGAFSSENMAFYRQNAGADGSEYFLTS